MKRLKYLFLEENEYIKGKRQMQHAMSFLPTEIKISNTLLVKRNL